MADAFFGFVAHPFAVVADVFGQALGSFPQPLMAFSRIALRLPFGIDRRHPGKFRRYLDHRLVDQHRHRVKVRRISLKPQPLRLKRQGPAARKRIVKRRQLVPVKKLLCPRMIGIISTRPPPTLPNLRPSLSSTVSFVVFSQRTSSSMILNSRSRSCSAIMSSKFGSGPGSGDSILASSAFAFTSVAVAQTACRSLSIRLSLLSQLVVHLKLSTYSEGSSTICEKITALAAAKRPPRPPQMQRTRMPMS